MFVPATPELEKWRPRIIDEVEKLIKTFDIKFDQIHPEIFVTTDGTLYVGEGAYRPPGFKAFELIERAYGVNAYQSSMLVFDPKTTEEEIEAFFPRAVEDTKGHAGCFPSILSDESSAVWKFPKRRLNTNTSRSMNCRLRWKNRSLSGPLLETHWGLMFFFGDNPVKLRDLLRHQEEFDFYV